MLALFSLALSCPIEDGTAFGAPYTVAAEPPPYIEKGFLVFQATYTAGCGGAPFEVTRFGKEHAEDGPAILTSSVMLVAARSAPVCAAPSLVETEITEEIRAPLPAVALTPIAATRFFACPPGSLYEMMRVDERAVQTKPTFIDAKLSLEGKQPPDWDEEEDGVWEPLSAGAGFGTAESHDESTAYADPVQEARRVSAELATQSAHDSIAHLAHCEKQQQLGNPSKCCSEQMMDGLRTKIAADAGGSDSQMPMAEPELNASEAADTDAETLTPELQAAAIEASGGAFTLHSN